MKECTLQEAVELCEKHGGSFKIPSFPHSILSQKTLCIYEPQKKSAFQEWNGKKPIEKFITEYQKQGWNALADYLINSNIGLSQQAKQQIEALKEP